MLKDDTVGDSSKRRKNWGFCFIGNSPRTGTVITEPEIPVCAPLARVTYSITLEV